MNRKAFLLLVSLGVLWGIPYLLIRIAVVDYHPTIVAFARAGLGAMFLLPFALRERSFFAGFKKPVWLLAYTLTEISAPWFLIGYAEQHVTSSLAGLVVALTPIIAAVLGVAITKEKLGVPRVCGLLLGLCGVVALLGLHDTSIQILPILALCLSALGYAIGPIIVAKKLADTDTTAVVVASLILASVIYLPFVPAHWPSQFSMSATMAVVALALFCTALAFQLLFALVSEIGPARSTVVAYINPAVAAVLGIAILDEPLTTGIVVGFVLILTGSYLATWNRGQKAVKARKFVAEPER